MKTAPVRSFWQFLLLSGAVSVVVYTLHVVIGGALWEGYSHIRQPISDLTATGAPNAPLLRTYTFIYGVLGVVFSFSLFMVLKNRGGRVLKIGTVLLLIMEFSSFSGYALFPLDISGEVNSIRNIMHIIVTAVVVITTIASAFLIGIGLKKIPAAAAVGIFVLACGGVIDLSGAGTAVIAARGIPLTGLVERINIFTLQLMVLVLSLRFFYSAGEFHA
jgi:hypothetical protein